jgi:hypothetical protein
MSLVRAEQTLEEMLADPIVRLVMTRDNVAADETRRIMYEAQAAYRRRESFAGRGTYRRPAWPASAREN